MKLSDMIDLLEKLKSQDGDIEITEISVELNESRTTTIPMKAYANALKSKKADTGDFCLYFHNAPTGWQIYEEPEPQYKVGDWVKYDIDSYLQVIEPSGKERTLCRTLSGVIVYPYTSCLTNASPSEVIIRIGCLSGTIAKSSDPNYFLMLHSRPITDCNYSIIKFTAIDTQTRELVEGLLKAQMEEANGH